MASGFECARIAKVMFPKTQFAQPGAIEDASTIITPTDTLDFQPITADEYVILGCRLLEDYDGGGIKLRFCWVSSATSGSARWVASIRSTDVGDSITASFTWSTNEQGVTTATSGTAGTEVQSEITFADGAQINSILKGEAFELRIHRDYDHAGDDLAVDARILVHTLAILEV